MRDHPPYTKYTPEEIQELDPDFQFDPTKPTFTPREFKQDPHALSARLEEELLHPPHLASVQLEHEIDPDHDPDHETYLSDGDFSS